MGRIACCNVLSDLYAMGVVNCDTIQLLLSLSTRMDEKSRHITSKLIIAGFRDCAREAGGCEVTSCEIVHNPWVILGGIASSVCLPDEFIVPNAAEPGDVLVLTKPLGTQVAVNVYQWMNAKPGTWGAERWAELNKGVIGVKEARQAYFVAMNSMAMLNMTAARLMHKYGAHGSTDVTGFGILGHANNLAQVQRYDVAFLITNLPIIAGMTAIAASLNPPIFKLLEGRSAETSGGLLIALPRNQASSFCMELERLTGWPAWLVGVVESASSAMHLRGTARIEPNPRIIEFEMEVDEIVDSSLTNGSSSSSEKCHNKLLANGCETCPIASSSSG